MTCRGEGLANSATPTPFVSSSIERSRDAPVETLGAGDRISTTFSTALELRSIQMGYSSWYSFKWLVSYRLPGRLSARRKPLRYARKGGILPRNGQLGGLRTTTPFPPKGRPNYLLARRHDHRQREKYCHLRTMHHLLQGPRFEWKILSWLHNPAETSERHAVHSVSAPGRRPYCRTYPSTRQRQRAERQERGSS